MKFEVNNRWTGKIQFTAEIQADSTTSWYAKLGMAVKWAIAHGANLSGANLSGADLRSANLRSANLRSADLRSANLRSANLSDADLRSANLSGADLRSANLSDADLRSADLRSANLSGANLSGCHGVNPYRVTPLLMLHDQPGKIIAYKLVNAQGRSPMHGDLLYPMGAIVRVANANENVAEHCAAGINVATLDWCMREWHEGWHILQVEFVAKDIAAIPTATDGKFRLKRCKVVAEVDLKFIGLTDK